MRGACRWEIYQGAVRTHVLFGFAFSLPDACARHNRRRNSAQKASKVQWLKRTVDAASAFKGEKKFTDHRDCSKEGTLLRFSAGALCLALHQELSLRGAKGLVLSEQSAPPRSDRIDCSMLLMSYAADHLSLKISMQIFPFLSIFG